jgi:chemotaxis signal transduction protein
MRVFNCFFENFSVAIPMDSISALDIYTENTIHNKAVVYNQEEMRFYVSLFCLFNLQPKKNIHGIILKNAVSENEIVILGTPVEDEINIPDNKIYSIPKTLIDTRFSRFFSGIQFLENSKPVLILDSNKIIKNIQMGENYD